MSAHDQMRQMLDQLMGTGRDGKYLKTVALFDFNLYEMSAAKQAWNELE